MTPNEATLPVRHIMTGIAVALSMPVAGIASPLETPVSARVALATEETPERTGAGEEGEGHASDVRLLAQPIDGVARVGTEVRFVLEIGLPDDGDEDTALWTSVTSVTASVDGMPMELSPDVATAETDPTLGTISEGKSMTLSGIHAITEAELEAGRLTCVTDAKLAESAINMASTPPIATRQGIHGVTTSATVSLSPEAQKGVTGGQARGSEGWSLPQTGRGQSDAIALSTVMAVAGMMAATMWAKGSGKGSGKGD